MHHVHWTAFCLDLRLYYFLPPFWSLWILFCAIFVDLGHLVPDKHIQSCTAVSDTVFDMPPRFLLVEMSSLNSKYHVIYPMNLSLIQSLFSTFQKKKGFWKWRIKSHTFVTGFFFRKFYFVCFLCREWLQMASNRGATFLEFWYRSHSRAF